MNYKLMFLDVFLAALPVVGMLVLYHFFTRAAAKISEHERANFVEKIKPGDIIETRSGIVAYVVEKNGEDLIIKSCSSHFKIKIDAILKKLPA